MLDPKKPAVILAPMEGVTDHPMREFLTRTGAYDYCVSEFLRVSGHPIPKKVFTRDVPEVLNKSQTQALIPVQVQILGGNPEHMAQSALHAIEAGALGIDLNFGCPAPTVNRNDGGATLLKYPERLEGIIRAVREAVPKHLPVSAKMRLGFDDPNAIFENALRAERAGASWITIHGRTKTQGYTPPAYWKPIGAVAKTLSIPVIANGEIFTLDDFKRCRDETGSIHFMLGRGALAQPNLAMKIRRELGIPDLSLKPSLHFNDDYSAKTWGKVFQEFSKLDTSPKRIKQWSRYLASKHNITWWDTVKTLPISESIIEYLLTVS